MVIVPLVVLSGRDTSAISIYQPHHPFSSQTSHAPHNLHRWRFSRPWSPVRWPYGHHRRNRKLRSQESPHRPRQLRRHPLLGYVSETPTPNTAMVLYNEPIYGFSGEKVFTRDYIDLHIVFRDGAQTKTIHIHFLIVDAPTSYNVLLGRPSPNTLGTVVSTPHQAMKFPSPSGDILTIHGDQRLAHECYIASLRP